MRNRSSAKNTSQLTLNASKRSKQRRVRSAPKTKPKLRNNRITTAQAKLTKPHTPTDNEPMTLEVRLSDHSAAKIIQKEVRRFLGSLGFYEARNNSTPRLSLESPERTSTSQINLFIKAKGLKSKQSSPYYQTTSRKSSRRSYELVDPTSSQKSIRLEMSPE